MGGEGEEWRGLPRAGWAEGTALREGAEVIEGWDPLEHTLRPHVPSV